MIIGILGSGRVGQAVGRLWAADGHTVYFGSRQPEKIKNDVTTYGPHTYAVSLKEAAEHAEVVLSALPYDAVKEAYKTLAPLLKGKVVIEAGNPFGISRQGGIVSTVNEPAGVYTARLLPQSHVVRAFNHIIVNLVPTHGKLHPLDWAIPVAADDVHAREVANQLIASAGYEPVNAGTLAESAILDPGGELFLRMYTPYDMQQALHKLRT